MKKFPVLLIAILFITLAGCQTTPAPQANRTVNPPATQAPSPNAKPNPCGDGICGPAEQADPNLCPADCAATAPPPTKGAQPASPTPQNTQPKPPTPTQKPAPTDTPTPIPTVASTDTPAPTPTTETLPAELTFIPDSGIRIKNAAQPAPTIADDGSIYIFYSNKAVLPNDPSSNAAAYSADGLTFTETNLDPHQVPVINPFATRLPDGTWRLYDLDGQTGIITSRSSTDGIHFTPDDGIRYTTPAEQMPVGVRDFFVNTAGDVIYMYIGAMAKENHYIRQAVSTDGGDTFTFYADDPLGDKDTSGFDRNVDPKFVTLPDGSARLITMVQKNPPIPKQRACCDIYSFTSADGYTFTQAPGIRLRASDFTEFTVWSLNDPWMIQLPDGRFRIYVAALIDDGTTEPYYGIVSATTP